jgi:hypothetical protein
LANGRQTNHGARPSLLHHSIHTDNQPSRERRSTSPCLMLRIVRCCTRTATNTASETPTAFCLDHVRIRQILLHSCSYVCGATSTRICSTTIISRKRSAVTQGLVPCRSSPPLCVSVTDILARPVRTILPNTVVHLPCESDLHNPETPFPRDGSGLILLQG